MCTEQRQPARLYGFEEARKNGGAGCVTFLVTGIQDCSSMRVTVKIFQSDSPQVLPRFSNDAGMVLILAVDLQVQRLAAFKFHLSGTRLQ